MRRMKMLIVLSLLLSLIACQPKNVTSLQNTWTYQLDESTPDLICLAGRGVANKKEMVLANGIKDAFKAIMLNGIPDSPYRSPLVTVNETNEVVINQIITERYQQYIANSWLVSPPERLSRNTDFTAPVKVVIDLNFLKRDMRSKGLLPRFGL
ncbi:hypothetical protein [Lewinella cohaerens]|uniref:hypothetical protein n=1 Tax=Lewinella cohaerens TaxID=70995 RepID=UPI0003A621FA|nr:hypothetical protein [Lewinella cohaerens]